MARVAQAFMAKSPLVVATGAYGPMSLLVVEWTRSTVQFADFDGVHTGSTLIPKDFILPCASRQVPRQTFPSAVSVYHASILIVSRWQPCSTARLQHVWGQSKHFYHQNFTLRPNMSSFARMSWHLRGAESAKLDQQGGSCDAEDSM
jgi:hypothetical protein